MPRKCWWCDTPLPESSMQVATHGDNAVLCGACGVRYSAFLLLTISAATWQLIGRRQGWDVERDGDVLLIKEA